MSGPTRKLHFALIRLAKGMIEAWEKWLNEEDPQRLDHRYQRQLINK